MITQLLIILVLYIVFDLLWFGLTGNIYVSSVKAMQKSSSKFLQRIYSSIVAWFLLALGLYVFVLPKSTSTMVAAFYGSLYGLIVYGVHNSTNYLKFSGNSRLILLNSLFGVLASGGISALTHKYYN
jgi:uncharacterized membrane protein